MKYLVQPVDESELPDGVGWLIVERDDGPPILLISGEVARCWEFMRAWEDTLEPCWQPTVSLPYELHAVG
jgi:hypothetical protein